uniref:Odorant receptor n=1 Tax=Leucinodes orbonalis TaxID=711050 RepID=A0AAU0QL40_9NEOP|nr:odorant receptor [Leucinodes orbonalis]
MFNSLLLKLESPDHPLLAPTLSGLKTWGIWQQNSTRRALSNAIHIAAIIFVLSQYIELWIIRDDLDLALRNLSVTMLSSVCVVKAGTFVIWHQRWTHVVEYVSAQEKTQLSQKDKRTNEVIDEYTKYARRVTYFYWTLVAATVVTVILAPLAGFLSSAENRERIRNGTAPYPEIMSSWVPFDKTQGIGYWVTVLEHTLICFYGGGVVATYDTNAVVLMTFFAGQMRLLSVNCSRLFETVPESSYEDEMRKIAECHRHHSLLLKYSKILNELLSPVMFLYVIICSLMICASAIQMTTEGTTTMQRIWLAEYLIALIAQLFLYCWHSNEVLIMSNKVEDGVYVSTWWSRGVRAQRSVLLLAAKLRRSVVFTAGPFTKLTLATFLAVLKGSYSYYTLLISKKDN